MRGSLVSLLAAAAIGAGLAAGAALAAAPQPKKPVAIDRFLGRWYEIARTPNVNQKNCWAPTMTWTRVSADRYAVSQTCRKGSVSGPVSSTKSSVSIVDSKTNAKLNVGFFGGVVKQEYWVLDHADDYRWALVGTPGGNFIWVLARKPSLSSAERAEVIGRVRALGYNPGKLQYAGLTVAGGDTAGTP
jgi:apolipoprotein D and lipocalin family protein